MIVLLTNVENIGNIQLEINRPNVDYNYWRNTSNNIISQLDFYLKQMDCTIEYDCGRFCMTKYPIYSVYISNFYYYLLKLDNQLLYNEYFDKIINRHINNIIFEYNNPYIPKTKKSKKKQNKFIKQITHDLFTGKEVYHFVNIKTNKTIISNKDIENELNNKKHKSVDLSNMTFKFK